jgi:DNA-binding transcriptional LysR family regulator
MVDQLLQRSKLDVPRIRIEMELNSFEAIKNAVQAGLGAAFLPVVSIERELAAGTLHRPQVADLMVRRQLKLITHPARYCSRASEAFRREVLPVFASPDSPLRQGSTPRTEAPPPAGAVSSPAGSSGPAPVAPASTAPLSL